MPHDQISYQCGLGRCLYSSSMGVSAMIHSLLMRITANLPCRLIDINSSPYLERYYLGSFLEATFYLHRFVNGDGDRELHDHPWRWARSLVLTGWYIEERSMGLCPHQGWIPSVKKVRFWNRIGMSDFHQIKKARPNTWTLFIHGERVKGWGFLKKETPSRRMETTPYYHQPFDYHASINWWLNSPIGKNAGREL